MYIVLDHVYNVEVPERLKNIQLSNKSKNICRLRNGFWQHLQNKLLFLKKYDLEIAW